MKTEYIIVGDTKDYKDCLIYTCGTFERAKEVLQKMFADPTEQDKEEMKKHTNIHIKEVNSNEFWWNDPFLAN